MEYQFTGFSHQGEMREFAFDAVAPDRSKTHFKVIANLELSRKYHIAVQELPLLCRRLLEASWQGEGSRTFTFTEADMQKLSATRDAARGQETHKRAIRRTKPVSSPWQQRMEPAPGQ
jgi:hypothetical protein